jgi:alpha/beta hydrolase family protein
MGGPHATGDLELGHDTQVWLATSNDPAGATTDQFGFPFPTPVCSLPLNTLDARYIFPAGVVAFDAWLRTGQSPSRAVPIALGGDGIQRDSFGIAVGGIKIPPVAVPTAPEVHRIVPSPDLRCRCRSTRPRRGGSGSRSARGLARAEVGPAAVGPDVANEAVEAADRGAVLGHVHRLAHDLDDRS